MLYLSNVHALSTDSIRSKLYIDIVSSSIFLNWLSKWLPTAIL